MGRLAVSPISEVGERREREGITEHLLLGQNHYNASLHPFGDFVCILVFRFM
jgi:hypothetical protein